MPNDEIREAKIMRMSGKTYAEIGKMLGVTRQRAHQLVGDVTVSCDDVQTEKYCKVVESLLILRKYQNSVEQYVIDDVVDFVSGLMNKVESIEKEIERLKRSDTE